MLLECLSPLTWTLDSGMMLQLGASIKHAGKSLVCVEATSMKINIFVVGWADLEDESEGELDLDEIRFRDTTKIKV